MKRALLIGNFGVGNLGDEALKEYFLTEFPGVAWTVVSASPSSRGDGADVGEVARLPGGVRSLLSLRWLKTISAYRSVDAVVFGGGSLFTDSESPYACFLWWIHASFAFLLGKNVYFTFQGIGPFRSSISAAFARSALRGGESISVRDQASYNRVQSFNLKTNCVQSFDPVFALMNTKNVQVSSQDILVLIPRKNSGVKFVEAAHKAYESRSWQSVRIVSMQPGHQSESVYVRQLSSTLPAETVSVSSIEELLTALADSGLVVSERYHGALAALALEKPLEIVSQVDGDKLMELSQQDPATFLTRIEAGRKELENLLQ